MGKAKAFLICAAAICCPIFVCSGSAAGNALRTSAYVSAGAFPENSGSVPDQPGVSGSPNDPNSNSPDNPYSPNSPDNTSDPTSSTYTNNTSDPMSTSSDNTSLPANKPVPVKRGTIITKNRSDRVDDVDFSKFTRRNGLIYRYTFERGLSEDYINLASGAQVRNSTDKDNSELEAASVQLPDIKVEDASQPTVLIYHTHTTESYMPQSDRFDTNYPDRSVDSSRNMVAVGDAICEALADHGISVVHDCTVHDNPEYVGAYNRSAETILKNLEEYPSIRLVIDIHRDGIANPDGSLVAPIAEVNGKNAAQFMIISGCDGERFSIPHYIENFKLACLLQNTSEKLYPNLARPVLFDYRDYNQSLFAGTLLIEVGSHGNSLKETTYTGELIGNIIAEAIKELE